MLGKKKNYLKLKLPSMLEFGQIWILTPAPGNIMYNYNCSSNILKKIYNLNILFLFFVFELIYLHIIYLQSWTVNSQVLGF